MIFGLIKDKPLLDEDSILWLFSIFEWSLRNFDAQIFYRDTILVTPTNEHFPGRASSVHGMAELMFEKVRAYAYMQHWPLRLTNDTSCNVADPALLQLGGSLRNVEATMPEVLDPSKQLIISYDPRQINDPEAMIATFAHTLAFYLGPMAAEPPPGGEQNWPQITEILAVFMGFGLMFANSAFTFTRGGCGSCRPQPVGRNNTLTQFYSTYALALFCVLKEIPNNQVTPHLKKSLRSFFRKSVKDIKARPEQLGRLPSSGSVLLTGTSG